MLSALCVVREMREYRIVNKLYEPLTLKNASCSYIIGFKIQAQAQDMHTQGYSRVYVFQKTDANLKDNYIGFTILWTVNVMQAAGSRVKNTFADNKQQPAAYVRNNLKLTLK